MNTTEPLARLIRTAIYAVLLVAIVAIYAYGISICWPAFHEMADHHYHWVQE